MSAAATLANGWRRIRLTLGLLVGRRTAMVIAVDALVLLFGFVAMLAGEADTAGVYIFMVLVPELLIGVPIMADAVALERRAGSLDLALSSPGADRYFERRIIPFAALLALQGSAVMIVEWCLATRPFPLVIVLIQTWLVAAVVAAATLFWAVRLTGTGEVVFASLLSLAVLGPWLFTSPAGPYDVSGRFFPAPADFLTILPPMLVLALAAVILYLYARRRLARPESLLR